MAHAPRIHSSGSAPARLRESVTSCPAPSRPCWVAAPTAASEPWSRWRTPRAAWRRRGTPQAGGECCERAGAGRARPPRLRAPLCPLSTSAAAPGPSRPFSSVTPPRRESRVGGTYCYPMFTPENPIPDTEKRGTARLWVYRPRVPAVYEPAWGFWCSCHCPGQAAGARFPRAFTHMRCGCPQAGSSPHSWFPSWVINPSRAGTGLLVYVRLLYQIKWGGGCLKTQQPTPYVLVGRLETGRATPSGCGPCGSQIFFKPRSLHRNLYGPPFCASVSPPVK